MRYYIGLLMLDVLLLFIFILTHLRRGEKRGQERRGSEDSVATGEWLLSCARKDLERR